MNCNFLNFLVELRSAQIFWGILSGAVGWGTALQVRGFYYRCGHFYWYNPSGRTVVLGSTQPLTDVSTRIFAGGLMRPLYKADILTTFVFRLPRNSGSLLEPSEPVQTRVRITFTRYFESQVCYSLIASYQKHSCVSVNHVGWIGQIGEFSNFSFQKLPKNIWNLLWLNVCGHQKHTYCNRCKRSGENSRQSRLPLSELYEEESITSASLPASKTRMLHPAMKAFCRLLMV